jgi:hypothetical protein
MYRNEKNAPNDAKIHIPKAIKTKCQSNILTSCVVRPSNIDLNLNFWFENIPSALGVKFTPRGKLQPWGANHVVKNWPLSPMVGCQAGPGILKRAKNVDVY